MADIKIISKQNGVAVVLPTETVFLGDPDGDYVAEFGALSTQLNIKRDIDTFYVVKNVVWTDIKDSAGVQIGTSRDNCVSVLNSDYFNRTSKIQELDNVDFQNTIAADQVLKFVDIGGGTLRISNEDESQVSIGATATDVLKMTAGQSLGAFDAGADKLVFWDDSDSKLTYATIGTNLTMTGTTLSASGGGGGSANMSQSFSAPTSVGEFQDGARLVTGAYGTAPSATAGTLVNFGNTAPSLVGAQSVAAAATGMLTVVTDAASGDELLVEGVVKMSSNTGWSTAKKGAPLYMSTTAGQVTETAPSTAGEFVRVVGHVVDSSNSTIYFKPDNTWLEL